MASQPAAAQLAEPARGRIGTAACSSNICKDGVGLGTPRAHGPGARFPPLSAHAPSAMAPSRTLGAFRRRGRAEHDGGQQHQPCVRGRVVPVPARPRQVGRPLAVCSHRTGNVPGAERGEGTRLKGCRKPTYATLASERHLQQTGQGAGSGQGSNPAAASLAAATRQARQACAV